MCWVIWSLFLPGDFVRVAIGQLIAGDNFTQSSRGHVKAWKLSLKYHVNHLFSLFQKSTLKAF